jgi:uncharacterized protein (DUF488 family)
MTIFTIGHSSRTIEAFIALLRGAGIECLADIRAFPASRFAPQFNKEALADSLKEAKIGYVHMPALGGRRPKSKSPSPNGFWRVAGFRNYADYALTDAFRAGFDRLTALARERTVAIMCAEADWHKCHRRIVTDYLIAAGFDVRHILDKGIEPAHLTEGARPQPEGRVLYPAPQEQLL